MPDSVNVPSLYITPPFVALLLLNTESVTFNVPALFITPFESVTLFVKLFQDFTTSPLALTEPTFSISIVLPAPITVPLRCVYVPSPLSNKPFTALWLPTTSIFVPFKTPKSFLALSSWCIVKIFWSLED